MNSTAAQALISHFAEREAIALLGNRMVFLATAAETEGGWSVLHYTVLPRFPGPPAHWHAHTTERFTVLSGALSVYIGAERHVVQPGDLAVVPPGVVHRFANETDQPACFLVDLSPAGFEGYFRELAALIAHEPVWPPADPGKIERLTAKYDQHPPLEP